MPKRSPALRAARGADVFLGKSIEFEIGDEALDVIKVSMQVLDADGKKLQGKGPFAFVSWFSDEPGGVVAAAAPDGGISEGTNGGLIAELTAGLVSSIVTDADGRIDVDVEESGALSLYLNVALEDRVFTSPVITWAA
jgi:hypothetical protein